MESTAETISAVDNRAKRLSKPRTNTSSSNLLALRDQPANIAPSVATSESSRTSEEQRSTSHDGEKRRTRRKSMVRIASFFKKPSTEDDEGSDYETPSAIPTENSPYSKKRSSTVATVSNISRLPSARPSTANLLTKPNLSLRDEGSVRLLDEIKIKEKALADTRAALTHVPSPVDEDKHPDSMKSPIRRKSLYTPGIATRNPHDILRKPPPPPRIESQADRAYYYNPMYSETSPLARLASLELPSNGRSTPCDLDRTHLGGLSLGTLRVTNGAASPEPGLESLSLRPLSSARSEDDFYTASEGIRSDNEDTTTRIEAEVRNCRRRASGRLASPLKNQHRPLEVEAEVLCSNCENLQPTECEPESSHQEHSLIQDDSASFIAQGYISEIPDSPFKSSNPSIPTVEDEHDSEVHRSDTLSVKQYSDDTTDLVDETSRRGASCSRTYVDIARELPTPSDAYERLNARAARDPEYTIRPVSTSTVYSRTADSEASNTQSTVGSFSDKTDSGYVSDVSGRAVTWSKRAFDEDIKARLSSDPLPDHECRDHQGESRDRVRQAGPACPDQSLAAPQMSSYLRLSKSQSRTQDISPGATPVHPQSRSSSSSWRLSLPALTVSRKLQKARRLSQPSPVEAYLARELSQSQLPLVPPELVTRMSERAIEFPLLERTFTNANSTAPTTLPYQQLAVGPVRFPSVSSQIGEQSEIDKRIDAICRSDIDWPSKKSKNKKEEAKQKKADAVGGTEKKRTKLSKAKRQPSEAETMATISDFGTVTESLGGSPYDIAMATAHPKARSRSPTGKLQPYRVSTFVPRVKQTVGMNDEEAAEFARLNNERYRRRSSSIGKPDNSVLANADDAALTSRRKPRPKSMYADVPPIPCLPVKPISNETEPSADIIARPQGRETVQPWPERATRAQCGPVDPNAIAKSEVSPDPVTATRRPSSRIKALTARPRPRSMYADVPPVPAMPAPTLDERRGMRIVKTNTLMPPQRYEVETNGSDRELRSSAPPEATPRIKEETQDSLWAASCSAWSQRRRSAGEALMQQQTTVVRDQPDEGKQITQTTTAPIQATFDSASNHRSGQGFSCTDNAVANEPSKERVSHPYQPRPPSSPPSPSQPDLRQNTESRSRQDLSSLPSNRPSPPFSQKSTAQSFSIPRKRVAAHVTAFDALCANPPSTSSPVLIPHDISTSAPPPPPPPPPKNDISGYHHIPTGPFTGLSGRYEGGLMYGYEPGFGLGGSAGTRTPKTGATRKSLGVSSTFGVDLSDVPVFVGRV